MRASRVLCGITATAMTVFGSLTAAPAAHASNFGVELNGTYRVLSDGQWARTNEVKIKQPTKIQTWNITTSCVSPVECTGEVRSDLGWTASARLADYWFIERVVPNWLPCPDGTFYDGRQMFIVYGFDDTRGERDNKNTDFLAGRDITKGPSGACGVNKPVVIELPVRMEKIA